MDIAGEYTFEAPRDLVWTALQDPDVLTSVMPGAESFEETGPNQYAGTLNIKVGPVRGKFKGKIQLQDVVEPDSYTMQVDGQGAPGFIKAVGHVKLEERGAQTHMSYSGTAQIGGRIASVGQRLIDTSARSIIRQSLDGLAEYMKQKLAHTAVEREAPATDQAAPEEAAAEPGGAAPAPEFHYQPPSQTEVARKVARDVLEEMVPKPVRVVVAVALAVAVAFAVGYILE